MELPRDTPMLDNPLSAEERALMPEIDLPPALARALELRVSQECFGTCQLHEEDQA